MEQLRKYYVLAVAALNFVICAIAFFIWTRIVVISEQIHLIIFTVVAILVSFILCYIYMTVAAKRGIIPDEKKNSLGNKSTLLSIVAVIIAVVIFEQVLQASDRVKVLYVPRIFSGSVYNVDIERIKDKVYILKRQYREEYGRPAE